MKPRSEARPAPILRGEGTAHGTRFHSSDFARPTAYGAACASGAATADSTRSAMCAFGSAASPRLA